MRKAETVMEDELRPEYDVRTLRLRKGGPGRQAFSGLTVRLEADVAAVFPDARAVNEALRFLSDVTHGACLEGKEPPLPPPSTILR